MQVFKLYYLLPIFLVSGPLLGDLLISLSTFFFIFYFLKNEKVIFKNNFTYLFVLFYIIINVSSIFSYDFLNSIKSSIPYFRFYFFSIIIFYLLKEKILKIEIFYIILTLLLLLLSLDGIYQFIFKKNIIGFVSPLDYRLTGFFNDEAVLGSFIARMLPLYYFFFKYVDNHNIKNNLLFYATFSVSFLCIVLSGERSSLGLIVIFLILISIFILNIKEKIFCATILILGAVLILNINMLKNRYVLMTYEGFFTTLGKFSIMDDKIKVSNDEKEFFRKEKKVKYIFSKAHDAQYRTAYKIFKDNPLVGSGIKTFRKICSKNKYYTNQFSCTTHPHNYYLQLLSETGFFSFLTIISVFLFYSYKFVISSIKNSNNINNLLYLNFILLLWPFFPTGSFFNNWLSAAIYFPIGFYLFVNSKEIYFKSKK